MLIFILEFRRAVLLYHQHVALDSIVTCCDSTILCHHVLGRLSFNVASSSVESQCVDVFLRLVVAVLVESSLSVLMFVDGAIEDVLVVPIEVVSSFVSRTCGSSCLDEWYWGASVSGWLSSICRFCERWFHLGGWFWSSCIRRWCISPSPLIARR